MTAEFARGVAMRGIVKSFSGVTVLDGVDFSLRAGVVHALAGENGAGKSTLLKILAGLYRADRGTIEMDGRPLSFASPRDALRAGVSMIHQELTPLRDMTVYENLFLGFEKMRGPFVDVSAMIAAARTMLGELDLAVDPRMPARDLSTAQLQLLEVIKAVTVHSVSVVLMDEPTSSLNAEETSRLYALVRRLRERGVAVAFTTHKMEELYAMADVVSVLRDGKLVATEPASELDEERLIRLMVGRELSGMFAIDPSETARRSDEPPAVEIRNLGRDGEFEGVTLAVRPGEIVGLAGLLGSGRSEMLESIFGLRRAQRGTIAIGGADVRIASPRDAIRHGVAFVGEDRKRSGIVPDLGVGENVSLRALRRFAPGGFIDARAEQSAARGVVKDLAIKISSLAQPIRTLSGGNQQKAVVGKWLLARPAPKVYLLVEPTRGVDVGAKAQIYDLLRRLAREGAAVVFASGELPELMTLSDRIVVMRKGRIAGEVERVRFSQEGIMQLAAAGSDVA
ncbi:MAG: sugar ABC transporter ATP-binding protein [Candidatus Eremiobacteraeota bacterium]|nr:sugar ABC transporter ATP-binding protein [Candidatus Eremiobacteraeota bacterium]